MICRVFRCDWTERSWSLITVSLQGWSVLVYNRSFDFLLHFHSARSTPALCTRSNFRFVALQRQRIVLVQHKNIMSAFFSISSRYRLFCHWKYPLMTRTSSFCVFRWNSWYPRSYDMTSPSCSCHPLSFWSSFTIGHVLVQAKRREEFTEFTSRRQNTTWLSRVVCISASFTESIKTLSCSNYSSYSRLQIEYSYWATSTRDVHFYTSLNCP